MNYKTAPYEGDRPYLFFSYCSRDAADVRPLIDRLTADGYRVWYDEGVRPGEDWNETIARQIDHCAVYMAAVTECFSVSHHCRNELNYVISEKIPLIPILMSDFPMTPGLKLQLASAQYIRRADYPDDASFFGKLYASPELKQCLQTDADAGSDDRRAAHLYCRETGERVRLSGQEFILGRSNIWPEGTLSDHRASRLHARILLRAGVHLLEVSDVRSANGTFLNQKALPPGTIRHLADGDEIRIGQNIYHIIYTAPKG